MYSKRTVKKSTGEVSYYTQCLNFWKPGCPRMHGSKIKCQECERQAYKKLEKQQILSHLRGEAEDGTDVIGVYPLLADGTCRFVVYDFDNHEKDAEKHDFANTDNAWKEEVDALREICKINDIDALVERSRSGNSAFVDENWNAYPDQWEILFSKPKHTQEYIEDKMKEWKVQSTSAIDELSEIFDKDDEKPWEKAKNFVKQDVDGTMRIILANAIYIDTSNLKPRIQNQIRGLAAFLNPVFFKNQAMGLSNFDNARYIYLGNDENGHIKIPRGLLELIVAECDLAGIEYEIKDKRCNGRMIEAAFNGQLKESQIPAIEKLTQNDIGILSAATAFGKTVVCCNIIAQKKVNTLILLQSSALVQQWEDSLKRFLTIEEEAPEYETPSGRKKRRKSVIGRLQGPHDSTTGIIDIAMVGSVYRGGAFHNRLQDYGLVIVDECHHAASDTMVAVLQEVKAKYVYGVTATPFRGDRLEKINEMLLGPIRYQYTSKDRAKEQGVAHLVYPRFTRAVVPGFGQDNMHPNDVYEIVRYNGDRDDLIVSDVKQCIADGRTPVVLSKYVNHSERLYERLASHADKIFLLSGKNSKKEHWAILQKMNQVRADESMILVATGKLIGEGFDFPRLDTLIMATPVAGKNVVEQYAGRSSYPVRP